MDLTAVFLCQLFVNPLVSVFRFPFLLILFPRERRSRGVSRFAQTVGCRERKKRVDALKEV